MKQESIFEEYFGDTPPVRVLNFLILGKDFDYSMTDIAEGSHVGWTSFTRAWKELERKKVVVHTRDIGRAKLYKLNTQDPTVQKLIKLHWEIIKSETDKMLSKNKKMLATS
ncbi:helix-turn-helix transcriptional regulator [Candidatus Woesearchaeota archaeon]|nr:helix-turn-helix transcriptional regulator [Candidatus Woesearchaeota archaeon]